MHLLGRGRQIDLLEQADKLGKLRCAAIFLLEHASVFPLHGVPVGVIGPVVLDHVDEEQAEHLDAEGCEALFLFEVLVDRAADHQPLQRVRVNVTHRLAGLQERLAAGQLDFQ